MMRLLLLIMVSINCFSAEAQQQSVQYQDSILASEFEQVFWEVKYYEQGADSNGLDSAYNLYLDKFLSLLENQTSLSYKFPFLSKHIKITCSPDNRLRYFQWGTQRESVNTTATIIQANINNKPYTIRLDTLTTNDELPIYSDILGIYQFNINNIRVYLVNEYFSYGHGSVGTELSARKVTNDSISPYLLFSVDSLTSSIRNDYSRIKSWEERKEIESHYNPKTKILTYHESFYWDVYAFEDEIQDEIDGKKMKRGSLHEIIEIKFDGEVFRPYKKYKPK